LLRREGYQIEVAYDGETALRMLQADPRSYDLLVLDWMLPKCSGLQICQQLRSQGDPTPVLFLTAKDTIDDRVRGLDAGADDYLVKPFELRELLARVRALLRRPPVVSPPQPPSELEPHRLQVQDLELDLHNQVAYRRGQAISLSEKESQLLAYLMRHPGQLLSHDQIYQHLWPTGEKPGSNVLAAQIRLLRRKIEIPAPHSTAADPTLIHTVYGKGYRLGGLLSDAESG
jgi:OmpR-family two-component system manganese-sensing response regulator